MRKTRTTLLVVGAGPAGLAAAAACRARGCDFLLVEAGARVADRDHRDHRRLGIGSGGSGLFSDGKFSFFPAAAGLWRLQRREALRAGWEWLAATLAGFGLSPPAPPDDGAPDPVPVPGPTGLSRKEYPSLYLGLPDRRRLIEVLEAGCGANLRPREELRRLHFDAGAGVFRGDLRRPGGETDRVEAAGVVFAGGRFGPGAWRAIFPQGPLTFRRAEVGVRLEQNAAAFFLRREAPLDPKLLAGSVDGRYGWRTFCCCRGGEVVATEVGGWVSVSGRADGPPTGRSNVGFNLRVTDAGLARALWPDGLPVPGWPGVAAQPLGEMLSRPDDGPVGRALGPGAARLLGEGLGLLAAAYPTLLRVPCTVIAPAVEGVGLYPELTDLQLAPYPCWVAGDATGLFRGLTAALVSGWYAAERATEHLAAR